MLIPWRQNVSYRWTPQGPEGPIMGNQALPGSKYIDSLLDLQFDYPLL
jgi:hypothetical protein